MRGDPRVEIPKGSKRTPESLEEIVKQVRLKKTQKEEGGDLLPSPHLHELSPQKKSANHQKNAEKEMKQYLQ